MNYIDLLILLALR